MSLCKEVQKLLQEFPGQAVDILADHPLTSHIRTCKKCSMLVNENKVVDSVLKSKNENAFDTVLPVRSIIVNEMNQFFDKSNSSAKLTFSPSLKVALVTCVIVFCLAAMLFTKMFIMPPSFKQQIIAAGKQDSTIVINRICSVTIGAGSKITIDKVAPRILKARLTSGVLSLTAEKKSYDTIAIRCGVLTIFATGTRFCVSREDSVISVTVFQGRVKVVSDLGYQDSLSKDEFLTFSNNRFFQKSIFPNKVAKHDSTELVKEVFQESFSKDSGKGKFSGDNDTSELKQIEMLHKTDKGSSADHYAIIRAMIHKGNFHSALYAIKDYQIQYNASDPVSYLDLGYCFYRLNLADSAIAAYSKANGCVLPEGIHQQVLHTINTLLYRKGDYPNAINSIQYYLEKYPESKWREKEYYYLINSQIALNRINDAKKSIAQARSELPKSCMITELSKLVTN